jgi:RimJ/RimL family protein N-acetyltransferase
MSEAAVGSPYDHLVVAVSGRLRIRHRHPDDFAREYAWRRDAELAGYDGRAPLTETLEGYIARVRVEMTSESDDRRVFSIETVDGCHIGMLMFYNTAAARSVVEIGISIGEADYRNRGYGREAIIAFVRYLWSAHPFRRIVLHTLEWNTRAQRAFAAAGFSEGQRIVNGEHVFLRMETRREWWLLWDAEGRFAAPAG